ncbi:MAG: 2-amino-4-hydroxy-6-hydroxymethyldihydropteridine diphosphokinase [Rickettsiales endosymbiont of Dermacentor nuttalli]
MIKIALGLGTNLGNRLENLIMAIRSLLDVGIISNITISSLYETTPLVPENTPGSWKNRTFYNIVIKGETNYTSLELIQKIKVTESILGRKKRLKWAPREIDIDILVYENQCINILHGELSLIIPHTDLLNRDFFLIPLVQLWPEWQYPVIGENLNKPLLAITENFTGTKTIINITQFPKIPL